ncbi:MAG: IclR family transcriptional regulator [Deltaproteobacteria bacterium]|nr:IclR family transcriptional regulator [Deltaproteobacteria bacterium]
MAATGEKYFFVSSLAKGLNVLELLAEHGELSVSEAAHHLGYNRAGSHRFLATLRELGYVEQTARNRYRLSLKLFRLGTAVAGRFEILRMARPLMNELAQAFNETVNLGYLDVSEVLHIDKIDSPEVLRMDSPVGSRAPAYCTGLGKAILAFLPDDERDRILETTVFQPHGPKTITSRKALIKELEKTRVNGYAVDNEELCKGVRCVAAPVFDHTGMSRFAISVAGPITRVTSARVKEIQKEVRRVCRTLSQALGNAA